MSKDEPDTFGAETEKGSAILAVRKIFSPKAAPIKIQSLEKSELSELVVGSGGLGLGLIAQFMATKKRIGLTDKHIRPISEKLGAIHA